MAKPIIVGDLQFTTQEAALDFVRGIRDRYRDGAVIDAPDGTFLASLLSLHPEADQKFGNGIAHFSVQTDAVFGTTRHFVVHREDGTSTDFSFKACIEGSSARRDALAALREAVAPQVTGFKQEAFEGRIDVPCGVRGTPTPFGDAHVDHIPPRTFAALVTGWLRDEGIELLDVLVTPPADNQLLTEMADHTQLTSWRQFHAKHALLRIVSAGANLSDVRRTKK
jgi:hypothetical protein